MSISVSGTPTSTSITVSCSYPSYVSEDSRTQTQDNSCTITWHWFWSSSSGSWVQNGWSHDAPSSISYSSGGYSGTLTLPAGGVDIGSRPPPPDYTGFDGDPASKTTTGTAHYSGTVTRPESGAIITSTIMSRSPGSFSASGSASNSFTYTFTGLSPDTTYNLSVEWFAGSGTSLGSNSTSGTTEAVTLPPSGTPSVSATRGNKSSSISWSSVVGATGYKVYANDQFGSGDVLKANVSSSPASITLDREYWEYHIKVVPYNSAGDGSVGDTYVYTLDVTDPDNVGISFTTGFVWNPITHTYEHSYTGDADDVLPTPNDGRSGIDTFRWYKHNGPSYVLQGTGSSFLYTGLVASTTYSFGIEAVDHDGNTSTMLVFPQTTPAAPPERPSNWSWSTAKTSGATFNLTAAEWNGFTARINEFREYKGLSATAFTTAITGNHFTASTYNQATGSIGSMLSPPAGPTTHMEGDLILASHLNDIADDLNSIT